MSVTKTDTKSHFMVNVAHKPLRMVIRKQKQIMFCVCLCKLVKTTGLMNGGVRKKVVCSIVELLHFFKSRFCHVSMKYEQTVVRHSLHSVP